MRADARRNLLTLLQAAKEVFAKAGADAPVRGIAGRGDPLLSPATRDVLVKIATAVPAHLRPFIAEPSTSMEPPLDAIEEAVETASLRDAIRKRLPFSTAPVRFADARTSWGQGVSRDSRAD